MDVVHRPPLFCHQILLAIAALALTAASVHAQDQRPPRFAEAVEVSRILIDVRAIDPRGRPVLGLGPADFEVRIGGRPAPVESVQHISGGGAMMASAETPVGLSSALVQPGAPGRLVVFLFQKNLHQTRIPGLMQMLLELRRTLDTFPPDDRVAVLRFDSRLRLLQDFSQDRDRLRLAFEHEVLFGRAPALGAPPVPSLRPALDRERADPSFSMEQALLRIAQALEPLPGPKSLVVVGHGFGRLGGIGVTLDAEYDEARQALQRARATVFCLDVTRADYHSLEAGLKIVADDTGGLYQRTHVFSRAALDRVVAALEGQYVLFVETPPLARGSHRLDVRLRHRDGVILAPAVYVY